MKMVDDNFEGVRYMEEMLHRIDNGDNMAWWPIGGYEPPTKLWKLERKKWKLLTISSFSEYERKVFTKWLKSNYPADQYYISRVEHFSTGVVLGDKNHSYRCTSICLGFANEDMRLAFCEMLTTIPERTIQFTVPYPLTKEAKRALSKINHYVLWDDDNGWYNEPEDEILLSMEDHSNAALVRLLCG